MQYQYEMSQGFPILIKARQTGSRRLPLLSLGWGGQLSSVDFWQRGPGAAAPGGVSGVSPEILSPLAPAGSALKKPLFERGQTHQSMGKP